MEKQTTIGIIGGGQLGMMLVQQAQVLGARCICLDPSPEAPAFALCDEHIVGAFDDRTALEQLCSRSDVIAYEFENVPGELLLALEARYPVKQGVRQLLESQDRLIEKRNAVKHGLPTPRFEAVDDRASLLAAIEKIGYPAVLKTRRLGYDGHGQAVLRGEEDLARAEELLSVPCILEEFISFDYETSVVMVADAEHAVHFPVGRNIHREGILDLCIVPDGVDDAMRQRIADRSERFMRSCGYEGILTIEYFVRGEELFFNEMAPRPHNSGHYTIEGCTTNQFREWAHYLLGMPLTEPRLLAPTVMKNVLGRDLEAAQALACESHEGVYVHLYGKREARPKRKMGHITFVGATEQSYRRQWAKRFE